MTNPVLVEVVRGAAIESRHRGAVAIYDAEGAEYLAIGDVDNPIFPRSAVKPFQALLLVESGRRRRLRPHRSASWRSPARPTAARPSTSRRSKASWRARVSTAARSNAAPIGRCTRRPARALARDHKAPNALHNNCSGKHAAMLCVACKLGIDHRHYIGAEHPVQREIRATLEDTFDLSLDTYSIDGCSIPTYAVPLSSLARAFARFGTGRHLGLDRAAAARRLMRCCGEHPFYLGGTDRFCTAVLGGLRNRAFVKIGAEGVIGGVVPELGLGIAVKCDDGGQRAAEVVMAALIMRLLAALGRRRRVPGATRSPADEELERPCGRPAQAHRSPCWKVGRSASKPGRACARSRREAPPAPPPCVFHAAVQRASRRSPAPGSPTGKTAGRQVRSPRRHCASPAAS